MHQIQLACVVAHASTPALVPGDGLGLTPSAVIIPNTPTVRRHLADAILDRALVLIGPVPDYDAWERDVLERRERLLTRLADALAHRPRRTASAA